MALFSNPGSNKQNDNNNTAELDAANFRILQLEKKISELSLTLEALWALLVEENHFSESALEDKITARKDDIEARANETVTCSSCHRTVPVNKGSCYYCGAKLT